MPEHSLIEMLKWMRPEGSSTQKYFCKIYLEPTFGMPDKHGNYIHIVNEADGSHPVVCFTAHHDTVHREQGKQNVVLSGDIASAVDSSCLGADCTTGCWLILGMIDAKIPGVYVIHAGEEVGCKGSAALVKDHPVWLDKIKAVISFDRKGTESVITHQMGRRTASDAFAVSFAEALGMNSLRPDTTGAYTDSNEYQHIVSECTNISVGYYGQHTPKETQDVYFAYELLDALCNADWSKLVFERDPDTASLSAWDDYNFYRQDYGSSIHKGASNAYKLEDIIRDYPVEVASLLDDWGVDANYLIEQLESLEYNAMFNRTMAV